MPLVPSELEEGKVLARRALRQGQWLQAERAHLAWLEEEQAGEAHFGLGVARWWLGQPRDALREWERSFAACRRSGDTAGAVLAAVYLCLGQRMSMGNEALAAGWLSRATAVANESGDDPLPGWLELCHAHLANEAGRPKEGLESAQAALAAARRTEDRSLELCASSEAGAALVALGRLVEGEQLLDGAMAGALAGESEDLDAVVLVSCRVVAVSSRHGQVRRAAQWIRASQDFQRRYGSPHLHTTCRTYLGHVLFATGRWTEAELELLAALGMAEAEPALHAVALATLSELRQAQGRLAEARALVEQRPDQPAIVRPLAALLLAEGQAGPAAALLERRLSQIETDGSEAAHLHELLVSAEGASGRLEAARRRARQMVRVYAGGQRVEAARRAWRALARTERTGRGEGARRAHARARGHYERALSAFADAELPYETARTRLELAVLLADVVPDVAAAEAKSALLQLDRLGAAGAADLARALLRRLGVRAGRSPATAGGLLTRREREVLLLLGDGLSNRDIAERLFITRKTVEHHVASVLAKLGVRHRAEAAVWAVRHVAGESATE